MFVSLLCEPVLVLSIPHVTFHFLSLLPWGKKPCLLLIALASFGSADSRATHVRVWPNNFIAIVKPSTTSALSIAQLIPFNLVFVQAGRANLLNTFAMHSGPRCKISPTPHQES